MSLVLDEFYNLIPHIGVSSTLGKGFDKIIPKAQDLKQEYFTVFLPELLGAGRPPKSDEDDVEFERLNKPPPQAMPTNPIGPNQETLITSNVQEQSAQQTESQDAPAEGSHELE